MNKLPDFLLSSSGYGLAMRWRAFLVMLIPVALNILPMVCKVSCSVVTESWLTDWVDGLAILGAFVLYAVGQFRAWKHKKLGTGKFSK